jgi:DNA ligase-1
MTTIINEPMLASEFSKQSQHIVYPCSVQPKLDGVRLLASRTGLNTRNGKVVPSDYFGGLGAELAEVLPPGLVLDGEMYMHGKGFEEIVSMFKRGDATLEYHVYDLMLLDAPSTPYAERRRMLVNFLHNNDAVLLAAVDTHMARTPDDVQRLHAQNVAAGYEGIMLRNEASPYEAGKRSRHLQKLKEFMTDEFVISDVVEATGADKGTAVFVCRRGSHDTKNIHPQQAANPKKSVDEFRVRMRASREDRRKQWEDRKDYIGRMLTVQFQELSTKNSLPRFPVGICIARGDFE